MCSQEKRYHIYGSSWFKRIAATFLAGSIIQSPISVFAQKVPSPTISNQAEFSYTNRKANQIFRGSTSQIQTIRDARLVDPLGRILGCGGEVLPDYTGYTVALYDPDSNDSTGTELGQLTQLTPTELPDIEGNGVFRGIEPNETNINPFPLDNSNEGFYNFLFDPNRGQTDAGRTYILVVNPPESSGFSQRRIKLEINQSTGGIQDNIVRYTATSL
ncbi:MAG: hypothetical protein ACFCUV_04645, partial [Rivularia sp. (in: cyanobacteria)]